MSNVLFFRQYVTTTFLNYKGNLLLSLVDERGRGIRIKVQRRLVTL